MFKEWLITKLGGYTDDEYTDEFRERIIAQEECDRAMVTVRELEAVVAKLNKPKRKYAKKG